jgi:DNA repair protein RadC
MRSRSDTQLLACALDLLPTHELREAVIAAGGPLGIYRAGAEALELDGAARARLEAWLELTRRMLGPNRRSAIETPEDLIEYVGSEKRLQGAESFWVVMLDSRGRPIGRREIARGSLTSCLVHPREVYAPAIRARAASILILHNHPSGDASPSRDDLDLTDRIREAGEVLGIPLIDHVVLGRSGLRSIGGSVQGSRVHMADTEVPTYHADVAPPIAMLPAGPGPAKPAHPPPLADGSLRAPLAARGSDPRGLRG